MKELTQYIINKNNSKSATGKFLNRNIYTAGGMWRDSPAGLSVMKKKLAMLTLNYHYSRSV